MSYIMHLKSIHNAWNFDYFLIIPPACIVNNPLRLIFEYHKDVFWTVPTYTCPNNDEAAGYVYKNELGTLCLYPLTRKRIARS